MAQISTHWVFGYGSLVWRPGFEFVRQAPALMRGVHRRLCVYSQRHRGTSVQPGLVFGLIPHQLDATLDDYAATMPAAGADDGHYTLELWHGFGLPLLLSALVLALGTAAFFSRERLRRAQ